MTKKIAKLKEAPNQNFIDAFVETERQAKSLDVTMKEYKEIFREFPGYKFNATDGSVVSVSNKTEDRNDGMKFEFSEQKFLELSPEIRLMIEEAGVVSLTPKIVKGQDPKVSVKLNNG